VSAEVPQIERAIVEDAVIAVGKLHGDGDGCWGGTTAESDFNRRRDYPKAAICLKKAPAETGAASIGIYWSRCDSRRYDLIPKLGLIGAAH